LEDEIARAQRTLDLLKASDLLKVDP